MELMWLETMSSRSSNNARCRPLRSAGYRGLFSRVAANDSPARFPANSGALQSHIGNMSATRVDAVPRRLWAPHKPHNPVARLGKVATAFSGLFPALTELPACADDAKRANFFTIGPPGQLGA